MLDKALKTKAYGILIPMQYTTLFIDLDDTVYPAQCGLWDVIKNRISLYMHDRLNLDWEVIPSLRSYYFKNFGTTMRGLMSDYSIDRNDYLQFVHDVPLTDFISRDDDLRRILECIPQRKVIFTNADTLHAERVMNILGITACFDQIIDINALFPDCKPLPAAYQKALELSGETDAHRCAFLDDSVTNLAGAKQAGFYTIRVGSVDPSDQYDAGILNLHEITKVIPC